LGKDASGTDVVPKLMLFIVKSFWFSVEFCCSYCVLGLLDDLRLLILELFASAFSFPKSYG
jgi:hypothetical protein